jgi:hypothetical protein
MYAIFPLIFFFSVFLCLLGWRQGVIRAFSDWRGAFLQACGVWGGMVVIISELLSLFDSLSGMWLTILWGLAFVVALIIGWRRKAFHEAWIKIGQIPWGSISWLEGFLVSALLAVTLLLFMIAWKAVPNTTDALLYHMSRVMHWAQNGNLNHYPTQYQHQLINPIWAELAILNLRLLWGNDQLANLVQWFSMVGSLIGVSAIARLLGAQRREQLLAASFVAAIPMGILQATSTQNDYVTTFWLVCLFYFIVLSKRRDLEPFEWVSLSIATGLGMLTKGTFYAYALIPLLWYFVPGLKKRGLRKTLIEGLGFICIVLVLNLGFWSRNLQTYGNPLGASEWIEGHTDVQTNPRQWVPAVTKQIGLNFVSAIPEVNERIINSVGKIHDLFGVELHGFGAFPWWSWNHEDLAGNPLHMLSVFFTLPVLLIVKPRMESKLALRYAVVAIGSFVILSLVFRYNIYFIRFHLPFFVLWGAVFGSAAYFSDLKRFSYLAAFMILFAAIPWLFMNRTRCIIAFHPHTYLGESVLCEESEFVLFANWHPLREPYIAVTEELKTIGCQDVGLRIDSSDLEYPYWRLLDAPQNGLRIESVDPASGLERYIDPGFKPCAIVCSVCGDRTRLHGLDLLGEYGEGIKLFTGSNFTLNEGG